MVKHLVSIFLLIISSTFQLHCSGQGYKIHFKINGIKQTDVQLGFYYSDKQYIVQTLKADKEGSGVFEGKNKLPGGVYMIIVPNKYYFDIIINEKQEISLTTDTTNFIEKTRFSGSPENETFYEYQKFMMKLQATLKKKMIGVTEKSDTALRIKNELAAEETEYWHKIAKKEPNSFVTKLLKMKYSWEKSDSLFYDEIDFNDDRMLRTPLFYLIIRRHVAKNIEKSSEYIIRQNDALISLANKNDEVKRFLATYLLDFYSTFYKAGMNEVFVYTAEKYFLAPQSTWADSTMKSQIKKRHDYFIRIFPGQIAPDVKLQTTKGDSLSLYQFNHKYTLLVFWSVGCTHCEIANFGIRDKYDQLKEKDVDVFSVCVDAKKDGEWIKYVNQQNFKWITFSDITEKSNYKEIYYVVSTPLAFLLDKDKKILTKCYGEENIKSLVKHIVEQ
jgi:peroxiredoxin